MKFSSGLNVALKLILVTIFSSTAALANFSIEDSQIFQARYFLKGNAMMKAVLMQAVACQNPNLQLTKQITLDAIAEHSFVAGDFNGDGKQDLVVHTSNAGKLYLLSGDGAGNFSTTSTKILTSGFALYQIASGDFNGDGKLDVITLAPDNGPNKLRIYLNNGSGGFANPIESEPRASSFMLGDFNKDGKTDYAVTLHCCPEGIAIYLSSPSGNYAVTNYAWGASHLSAVADFNSDGNLDVLTSDSYYPSHQVRLGNGRGQFTNGDYLYYGVNVYFFATTDFNKDGKLDVLGITGQNRAGQNEANSNKLIVMSGDGGGHFAVSYPAALDYQSIAADFNGDGYPDIANQPTNIYANNGGGGLCPAFSLGNSSTANRLGAADFNGDGKADLIRQAENKLEIWMSGGSTPTNTPPTITTRDQNGIPGRGATFTGIADVRDAETPIGNLTVTATSVPAGIVVSNIVNTQGSVSATIDFACNATVGANVIELTVKDGNGATTKGTFTLNVASAIPTLQVPASLTVAEGMSVVFDTPYSSIRGGTIKVEIPGFTGKIYNKEVSIYPPAPTWGLVDAGAPGQYTVNVTVSNAANTPCVGSTVTKSFPLTVTGASAACVYPTFQAGKEFVDSVGGSIISDFNKDGKQDFIYVEKLTRFSGGAPIPQKLFLRLGLGNGDFGTPQLLTSFPDVINSMKAADLNGDSNLDLTVTVFGGGTGGIVDVSTLTVLYGDGRGSFLINKTTLLLSTIEQIVDLNKDGKLDIVGMQGFRGEPGFGLAHVSLAVALNTGAAGAGFSSVTTYSSYYPLSAIATDYDQDGILDLVVSGYSTTYILKGDGNGNFPQGIPNTTYGGSDAVLYNLGDLNGDGKADIANIVGFPDAPFSYLNYGYLSLFGKNYLGFYFDFLAAGNFNGDSNPDVATSSRKIFINNGQSGFCAAPKYPFDPTLAADLNGDGKADVIERTATGFRVWLNTTGGGTANTPPTITVLPTVSSQGAYNTDVLIGSAADRETAASSLSVQLGANAPLGISFPATALRLRANGELLVDFIVSCSVPVGTYQIPIKVTDSSGLSATANWALTINANQAPPLRTYSNVALTTNSLEVLPSASWADDDSTAPQLIVSAPTYSGSITIDSSVTPGQSYGIVRIMNNNIPGTYQATITASDRCGLKTTSSFSFTIPPSTVGCPSPTFSSALNYNSNTQPYSIATADFNGDQRMDMAVVNGGADTVTIMIRQTDGSFIKNPTTYAVGPWANFVMTSDFNGDGKFDFAVTNKSSDLVTIFLGAGNGTFTKKGGYAIGSKSTGGAVGDFNNDGKPDLMVSNDGQGTVVLLINNGDGSFKAPRHFGFTSFDAPQPGVVRDFNGDGNLDVAIPLLNLGQVAIMLGDGQGNFTTRYVVTNLTGIGPMAAGDFNGDSRSDLIVVGGNGVAVTLLSNGNGTFVMGGSFSTQGNNVASVTVEDYNKDGKADVAFAGYSDSEVKVFQGLGNGTFAVNSPTIINVGSHPLGLINIYSGTKPSLAVANNGSGTVTVITNGCSQ